MRAAAIALLVTACGRTPAPPPPLAHQSASEGPRLHEKPKPFVDRHLSVDPRLSAMRGAWVLTIGEHSASLLRISQEAPAAGTVEQADRETKWRTTSTEWEKGPAHQVGDHLALDLESDHDALFLRCWHRPLKVATAGARRVPTPGRQGDCSDPGIWIPATLVAVDALVCGQGEGLDDGQLDGMDGQNGNLDETLFRFLPEPGIEFVEVSDGCFESKGLRLAR